MRAAAICSSSELRHRASGHADIAHSSPNGSEYRLRQRVGIRIGAGGGELRRELPDTCSSRAESANERDESKKVVPSGNIDRVNRLSNSLTNFSPARHDPQSKQQGSDIAGQSLTAG